jgi:hypothetical protein
MTYRRLFMMLLFSFLVVAGGCATHRINLTDTGHVTIENRSPGKVQILWSHAYEASGQFVVKGVLKRRDRGATPIPAHVHVLVLSQANRIAQSLESAELYVRRNKTGKGNNWKRFKVCSEQMPSPYSRLFVVAHTHNESQNDKELLSLLAVDSNDM